MSRRSLSLCIFRYALSMLQKVNHVWEGSCFSSKCVLENSPELQGRVGRGKESGSGE